MESSGTGRDVWIDDERLGRGIVEQQHRVGQQAVTAGDVDDAAAAVPSADATRDLPRLEQFLARELPDAADDAPQLVEQRGAREPIEIMSGQPIARAVRKRHS